MKRSTEEVAHDLDGQIASAVLAPVLDRLDDWAVPEPGPAETEALIASLRPLLPAPAQQKRPTARFRDTALEAPRASILRALLPQLHVFHPAWWAGSLLAVLLCLALAAPLAAQSVPVSALAPVLVIAGLICSFQTLRGSALELELSCPITPAQAILSRMLVVLGYNLVLGCLAALFYGGPVLMMLLAWCASVLLFAGLVLGLTMYTDTTTAAVIATGVWVAQLLLRQTRLTLYSLPDSGGWVPLQLAALAAGLVVLALTLTGPGLYWLIGRGDA